MTSLALAAMLHSQPQGRLDMLPYARMLNLSFVRHDDEVRLLMPFAPELIGSPGRLHGGAVTGLLELAGTVAVVAAQPDDGPLPRIRPVTVTVDFLREGAMRDTWAAAEITKRGRRVFNMRVIAWQGDRAKPIGGANINFVIDWPEAPLPDPAP